MISFQSTYKGKIMSKEKTKYRILRLRSGEDIIGTIKGKSKGKLIVHRPMQMKVSLLYSEQGDATKEVVLFRDWLKGTTQISANVPEDHIATFLTPSAEVIKLYEEEMEKQDCNPEPDSMISPLLKDLMEQQKKRQEQQPQVSNQQVEPGSILVSLAIPPAIFLHMVANGLLRDPEEMMEGFEPTDEELRDIEREVDETPPPPQRPQSSDENPDFGNRFEDWPDEPEDYM